MRQLDGSLDLLQSMVLIRRVEERLAELFSDGQIPGFVHLCIGQEAVATGICDPLQRDDRVVSNHRGHGHALAKGVEPGRLIAEILGRRDGCNGGMGGTLHIADTTVGFFGANGIVGAGIPLATGLALADSVRHQSRVTIAFFGDGATNEGVFFESLNLAALWRLPIIYVCENNQYSELAPAEDLSALRSVASVATIFGLAEARVNGNDVREVATAATEAVDRARRGEGSTLIEALTYRVREHAEGLEEIAGNYRSDEDIESWASRDPIDLELDRLRSEGVSEDAIVSLVADSEETVERAVSFASNSPFPHPDVSYEGLWA